uniref:C-type lectin domain-containing protein n=1 Tax=Seriola lalandi dorsalis TaxID=1841481 RepID=A0A3B4WM96_SERLL
MDAQPWNQVRTQLLITYPFSSLDISPDSVVCHGFAVGQTASRYNLIQTPMSWSKAREFCQKHHVDLAVLNTEEQYFTLLNATHANQASFWLGLQRQSIFSGWTWVNGELLSYEYCFFFGTMLICFLVES